MRHTPERHIDAADRTVKNIRRKTRKRYSSEDKMSVVRLWRWMATVGESGSSL